MPKDTGFKAVAQPGAAFAFVPDDLHIIIPKTSRVPVDDRHYLAYLPWEARYLSHIPRAYQAFFKFVLPFLHARTSNVHTALSISQLPYLLPAATGAVNKRLIYLALILHDSGWSQVSTQGLVQSLGYNGVAPSSQASHKPKQQHLIYGESLAYTLLDAFDFGDQPLSSDDIYAITSVIRRHDHDAAWEAGRYGHISDEVRIVCDADRLWSYTRENFWLDTIRKAVPPEAYLEAVTAEIDSYFFTDQGRDRARQLVAERQHEVEAHARLMQNPELRTLLIWQSRNPSRRMVYRTQQVALKLKSRRMHRAITRLTAS
jgi:hypothetical protein